MTLTDYLEKAMQTCMESSANYTYMAEGLVAEVGEFLGKVAKGVRKEKVVIHDSRLYYTHACSKEEADELEVELQKELGDILWFWAGICEVMGWNPDEVAQMNLDKLASRQKRGVIEGNGDNR